MLWTGTGGLNSSTGIPLANLGQSSTQKKIMALGAGFRKDKMVVTELRFFIKLGRLENACLVRV